MNDGGPAFPTTSIEYDQNNLAHHVQDRAGMSLRDWFAGRFTVYGEDIAAYLGKPLHAVGLDEQLLADAAIRYEFARYMLAEREKK